MLQNASATDTVLHTYVVIPSQGNVNVSPTWWEKHAIDVKMDFMILRPDVLLVNAMKLEVQAVSAIFTLDSAIARKALQDSCAMFAKMITMDFLFMVVKVSREIHNIYRTSIVSKLKGFNFKLMQISLAYCLITMSNRYYKDFLSAFSFYFNSFTR